VTQLESWTTGEEFCKDSLLVRGLDSNELEGWTVTLNDDNDSYELMGNDYVLDLISEMEVPPAFPVCKSFFLVSTDITKDGIQSHKRRSMTAGLNNPDSVYDWYFEMHQTENSADRLVLTKAIKGNSSNLNLDPQNYRQQQPKIINENPVSKSIKQKPEKPEKPILKSSSSYANVSSSNISNVLLSQTSTTSINNSNQKPSKPILKPDKNKNIIPLPPKRINKSNLAINDRVEIKSKNNGILNTFSEKSLKKPQRLNNNHPTTTTTTTANSNNKSIGRKRLSKVRASNLNSESKSKMYTLNKSKKGTLGNSRKQNFRFRFEPNKSTLTKIMIKDSLKSPSVPSHVVDEAKIKPIKQFSKSGYQLRDEKCSEILKDKKRIMKVKSEPYEEIDNNFDNRAFRLILTSLNQIFKIKLISFLALDCTILMLK
jgi:hypothetical protein